MNPASPSSPCPACGKANSFFNVVCAHCGQPLTSSPEVLADLHQPSADHHRAPSDSPAQSTAKGPWQRFDMQEVLGRGGMGTVYRAHDPQLNRAVAIKILHTHDHDRPRQLLLEEARKASTLSHPNLVTIYDLSTESDPPFLVMELIDGVPLSERLVAGPLAVDQALSIAVKIASALAAIHQSGLAHLDLKPANVMLTADDDICLLDFGLARAFGNRPADQAAVSVSGTWGYFSPEQSLGDAGGPAADMFALGVVLYEMLTGQLPFRRDSSEASLAALRRGEFPPLAANLPQHAALSRILKKCLHPRRSDRFKEMSSLVDALQRVQQHLAGPIQRRNTLSQKLIVGVAILFLTIAGTLLTLRFWPLPEPPAIARSAEHTTKRLLLVPFLNLADTAQGQILTDGIQQTLTQALLEHYETGDWWILPASEVRQHDTLTPSQARDLYQADFLIEGNLAEQGPVLRLGFSLVDTRQNRVVTAQSVETTDGSLVNLHIQAMQTLANILQLTPRNEQKLAALTWERPRRQAHEAYIRGMGLLYRYDVAENLHTARTSFEQAIAHDPTYASPHQGMAQTLVHLWRKSHQEADLNKADDHSLKATQLNPAWAAAWHTRGSISLLQGHHDAAQAYFEKALQLDPQAAGTLSELAKLNQKKNRPQEAETLHQQAVALHPHSWILHNRLGIFYTGRGRYEEAGTAFAQVVRMVPDNLVAYQNLAAVLHLQGRSEEALKAIQTALGHGQTPNLYSNLGTILFYIGRYDEAGDAFSEAVARNDRQHLLWGNLADAQRWTAGQEADALESYGKAIALAEALLAQNAKDEETAACLALYLAKSGQTQQAISHLSPFLPSSDGYTCYAAATVYELAGLRPSALEYIQCALNAGYSFQEIDHDPELRDLRKDPHFLKLRSP